MEDKVTVITGASKGLGNALAKLAIAEGHKVILNARTQDSLEELRGLAPDQVFLVPGDLTDRSVRQKIVNESTKLGRIDYLINNAGYGPIGLFENESESDTEFMINLNVLALIDLTRRSMTMLKASPQGRVMNIASVGGITDFPLIATYAATKFAVVGFSKALNTELAMTNASCTAYCPAGIKTEFFDHSLNSHGLNLADKMLEPVNRVANGIWKKRNTRKHIIFPTLWAWTQCTLSKLFDPIIRPFTRLYMKKRGRDTVAALTKGN